MAKESIRALNKYGETTDNLTPKAIIGSEYDETTNSHIFEAIGREYGETTNNHILTMIGSDYGSATGIHNAEITGSHHPKRSVGKYKGTVTEYPIPRPDLPTIGDVDNNCYPSITKNKGPKTAIRTFKVSTYNVRSLNKPGRFDELCSGCHKFGIDFAAIQEHRWSFDDNYRKTVSFNGKYIFVYTSAIKGVGGIGILIARKYEKFIDNIKPISNRILFISLRTNPVITIICTHAPTDCSNNNKKDIFYKDLSNVIYSLPEHNFTIIAGDMNARIGLNSRDRFPKIVGNYTYHQETNNNGERLISLCDSYKLLPACTKFRHPNRRLYTWLSMSHSGPVKSQIDHILIRSKWANSIKNCRAYSTIEVHSDHRIVTACFRLSLRCCYAPNNSVRIVKNWTPIINSAEEQNKFTIEVHNRYNALYNEFNDEYNEDDNPIQQKYDKFKGFIQETIKHAIKNNKKNNIPWISNHSLKLREHRDYAKKCFLRNKSRESKKIWMKAAKVLDESYKNDKINFYSDICKDLCEANKNNNLHEVYKIVGRLANKKPAKNASQIRKVNGEFPANNTDLKNEWELYFRSLLNPSNGNENLKTTIKAAEVDLPISTEKFSFSEILPIINGLKNRKAVGIDKVPAEFIKYGGHTIHNHILNICNDVFLNKTPPDDWMTNIIIPIPKKGSNTNTTSDFRGISLMSILVKIYNRLILNRIYKEINSKLRINQAGFRRNMNTVQQINTVRRILEGFNEKQLPLICTFVDFSKAFDSINREVMWCILRHYGIPSQIVDAIKCIYKDSKSVITIGKNFSDEIKTTSGVLQGDTLAPFLFIMVIDYIMKELPKNNGVVTHLEPITKLTDLCFADDIVLFDSSINKAYQHLRELEEGAAKAGLHINTHKTKFIANIEENTDKLDKKIEKVNDYIYLGASISSTENDIKRRLILAKSCFYNLKNIWKSAEIPVNLKINIFQTTCLAVLLYGCELLLRQPPKN